MFDGIEVVAALEACGITHVVWIPDSDLGTWDAALQAASGLSLIRVCRESEAMAVAAGLMLGGKRPVVVIQCTGLFDSGDALRNVIHDLNLPLFLIIGVRGLLAQRKQATKDTCPIFTEPILRAWRVPYVLLDEQHGVQDLATAYRMAQVENRAGAVLLAE